MASLPPPRAPASGLRIAAEERASLLQDIVKETKALARNQRNPRKYSTRQDANKGRPPASPMRGGVTAGPSAMASTSMSQSMMLSVGTMPSAVSTGSADALDDYDPKAAAEQELERVRAEVIALRRSASDRTQEAAALESQLKRIRDQIHELDMQNDVEQQKARAQEELTAMNEALEQLSQRYEHVGGYHYSLSHMLGRMRRQKVEDHTAMRAMEDANKVQKNELRLRKKQLSEAEKLVVQEEAEYKRVDDDLKFQQAQLDEKLEARRKEVVRFTKRAHERRLRLQEELQLQARAEGDLTQEQEQALLRQSGLLKAELFSASKQARTHLVSADKLEAAFNGVRIAAGVPQTEEEAAAAAQAETPGATGVSLQQYTHPQPDLIIERFHASKGEQEEVEMQLADLHQRLTHLQQLRRELAAGLQPAARDEHDERAFGVRESDELHRRITKARKDLHRAQGELATTQRMRVLLDQSIAAMHARLQSAASVDHAPAPPYGGTADVPRQMDPWGRELFSRVREICVFADRLQSSLSAAGLPELGQSHWSVHELPEDGSPHLDMAAAGQAGPDPAQLAVAVNGLISECDTAVRVKSAAAGEDGDVLSMKDFHNAAQRFRSRHKRLSGLGRALSGTAGRASAVALSPSSDPGTPHPFSKEAMLDRRRNSKLDIKSAIATAEAAAKERSEMAGIPDRTSRIGASQRHKVQQDMTKLVAAASLSAGNAVRDEHILIPHEAGDDMPTTHEKVKQRLQIEHQQLLAQRAPGPPLSCRPGPGGTAEDPQRHAPVRQLGVGE